ncbi:hypothetical protein Tco_1212832 [Tanacetum coccineum]
MSSTVELSKPYNCKVTIRSRPSTISFIKERISKSNKRLKLFKDTVFGKHLDLDMEDNDKHLLNYVLHHQRPQLSKSIDSNLVFDIAGHTLLFGRSEFSLVTGFACGKLVFPEYMDDDIPPFLRRVFPDKAKNMENKASLGKAAQGKVAKGKAAKGKAAKGKAAKGKDAKRKAAQGKTAKPNDIGQEDKKTVNNSFLRLVEDLAAWDDFSWGEYYWEEFYKKAMNLIDNHKDTHTNFKKKNPSKLPTFGYWNRSPTDSNPITQIRPDLKERDENGCRKTYDYVVYRASARAKFKETKSTREVALEEELDLWKSRYVELESYYKNLEASVEIARKNSPGLSFPTPNAKATSVCDDIDEADAAADDNAKATSVHDDVGVPDAAADDNAKATSVCDDINEADAAADDNAKATSVHDNVGVPDATTNDNAKVPISDVYNIPVDNENVLMKDAHEIINHTDPPIHGFQIIRHSKRHIQEVVSAANNGEAMKETQLPDSHENVFQPCASKRMKKKTLLSDCPPVIGNYLKEIHIARWEEGNGLNVDEKFRQSLVARDATCRGFLTLSVVELWVQLMWHFRPKHADCAIFSPYYCNLPTPYDLGDLIFKDISYPVGWADIETIQAWGNSVWTGVSDVLLSDPVLKHVAWVSELVLKHDVPFIYIDTRDEDKDTRGNTRDGKASRESENHTRESASILHEFYNDIGKLGLE